MFWWPESFLTSPGPFAPVPRPRRQPRPACAAAFTSVFISSIIVPPAFLPSTPNASRTAVQFASTAATILVTPAAGAPRARVRAVAGEGAQVRAVRAPRAGLGLRAGGAAGAEPELVAGARASGLPAGAGGVRRPAPRRAQLHHPRHAAGLRPQEHRAHGQRAGRGDPGLTRALAM